MHDLQFADAVRPARVVVLKLPLRPFSIGHELLLYRERNPLLFNGNFSEGQLHKALVQAANICSQSWSENIFKPRTWWERYRSDRVWKKWERARRDCDWRVEL